MGSLRTSEGEIRLALAELIRRDETVPVAERQRVRRVIGWADATQVMWQGMTCEYEVAQIEVFYETWDGETCGYLVEGKFGDIIAQLADLVDDLS